MPQIALLALAILAYTLTAARLDRLSISGPIVLVTVGALLGPAGVGALAAPAASEPFRVLAELTLALLLFTDASTIALREAGGIAWLPGRLLAIGLPLTIAGRGARRLAPVPRTRHRLRPAPRVDPGADRCRAQPARTARSRDPRPDPPRDQHRERPERRDRHAVREPVPGDRCRRRDHREPELADRCRCGDRRGDRRRRWSSVGLAVASRSKPVGRGWASRASESLAVVALAIVAYAGATAIGGNGFVAAFGAGIAFRTATGLSEPSVEFAESIGLAASYLVWLLFGVGLAGPAIAAGFDPAVIGYALLSLTIVRMVPVAIALVGARLRPDTVALIGWFGPRGLASVVFLLVAFDELGPAHPATDALVRVVTWTVLLSVFVHGLSAGPVGAWYGRRMARAAAGDWEVGGADEPRISRRHSLARPPSGGD